MPKRLWELSELNFRPDELLHYETLFTNGNGYMSTRGAFEEGYDGDTPVTLVHGIYDHAPGMLVPELVNVPNWLPIHITVDGTPFKLITKSSDFMKPPEGLLIGYERTLDLYRGVLKREILFRAASGAIVRIVFERFASLADEHLAVQRVTITGVEGSPTIQIGSGIDADVTNAGAQHWLDKRTIISEGNEIGVEVTAQQSGYVLGMASQFVAAQAVKSNGLTTAADAFRLDPEASVTFDKFTSIYTSRDGENPMRAAQQKVSEAVDIGWDAILQAHESEWAKYWADSDIRIEGDDDCQLALRFTTYHILIAAPRHDEHVSVGAKTLSGLGYKGHVFWDTELFLLPPLTLTQPEIAHNRLMYRYHNLQGARNKAKANGYEGAMFPWESTDTGEETTPQWSDPQPDGTKIRIWTGDSEQHISTDIAYAVMQFWRWTGDDAFIKQYGAEIVLDTAVFWGSRVESKNGRYEISQQIGPDEYHENIDNSVFVNRMVVWHLQTAVQMLVWLRDEAPADAARLTQALDLTRARLDHWHDIIANMYIPFDTEKQIHVQFPGFFDMEYIPVPDYQPRVTSVQAILGHKRTIQTQVIKQADVVMMMALLGDQLDAPDGSDIQQIRLNNWNTYYPRCDHGSSLSPAMHAWVAGRLGLIDQAYDLFHHAVHIDLDDNKGNVRDGIHAAACGGVWQAVVFGLCGLRLGDEEPTVDPHLPDHWRSVSFSVYHRGKRVSLTVKNPLPHFAS
ncbi:MAG TPA: glycosyl hydrolase family 65 protein [Phototrophicaceae bacterium]|nr:glycosyl hydrolase family 65 protein [Phototrophicaceae bacterium]